MELSHSWSRMVSGQNNFIIWRTGQMPKWRGNENIDDLMDDDFYEDEYGLDDEYVGFERIQARKRSEEEFSKSGKKKSSVKHQKRPDKD